MAEFSLPWTTDAATPEGDQQASYTQMQLAIMHSIIAACSGFEGVAPGVKNELACAAAGANTVSVATGGAVVDGIVYHNDASQNVNIPSAVGSGNTRIDRIVLRADWASFTVRVHRIAGVDAANPSAPAITQNSGTTYDIMLAQVLVDTAGTVTVTDERTWAALDPTGTEAAQRTRKLFIPAIPISPTVAAADGAILNDAAVDAAYGALTLPPDFVSGMTVKAVVVGSLTGTAVLTNRVYYAAAGQNRHTHTQQLLDQPTALTMSLVTEVLPITLSDVAAGDHIRLIFYRDGTNGSDTIAAPVYFYGWLVEYTADS